MNFLPFDRGEWPNMAREPRAVKHKSPGSSAQRVPDTPGSAILLEQLRTGAQCRDRSTSIASSI
jgi:hypothetical protein